MNTCALTQQTVAVASKASCTARMQERSVAAAPSARMANVASARLSARHSQGNTAFSAKRNPVRNTTRRTATIVAEGSRIPGAMFAAPYCDR
eukprot:1195537-Prorocentrum_minimum.AAC.1